MTFFRRRLIAWSVAWLVCQVATLSAFLPPHCCAAHEHAAEAVCHDEAPAEGEVCPMHAADGATCPMHQTAKAPTDPHAGHMGHEPPPATEDAMADVTATSQNDCYMRGICDVPAVALSLLLSAPAILPVDATDVELPPVVPQHGAFSSRLLTPPFPHHTPPPKA